MHSGDIVVGSKLPLRKADAVIADNLPRGADEPALGSADRHCGAMSQQCSHSGAVSTPQQFVHLVGCRDPKAGTRRGR